MDGITKYVQKYEEIKGWRKMDDWQFQLKGLMRELGKASASGGKNKDKRIKKAATNYWDKANTLAKKVEVAIQSFPIADAGRFSCKPDDCPLPWLDEKAHRFGRKAHNKRGNHPS